MKPIYTNFLIAIAFVGLTLLSNCNKREECPDSKTTTEDLTPLTLSKVPYTGYDTLYFLNKQGDTCIVRGTGKQYYYTTSSVSGNNPVCEPDYNTVQGFFISFTPIKGNLSLKFDLRNQRSLHVSVSEYAYVFVLRVYEIGVVGRPDDTLYVDTMTINNKLFNTISRVLYQTETLPFQTNDNYQAYYNKEFGLLKIENKELNEEYTIITK